MGTGTGGDGTITGWDGRKGNGDGGGDGRGHAGGSARGNGTGWDRDRSGDTDGLGWGGEPPEDGDRREKETRLGNRGAGEPCGSLLASGYTVGWPAGVGQ